MDTLKQMMGVLGEELLAACKQKANKQSALALAKEALLAGADVNYKGCRPMHFAVKNYNFPLVRLLINNGALLASTARKYLASACERGGFSQKRENDFFAEIDYAINITGFDMVYIYPYINAMLLAGQAEKVRAVCVKYGLALPDALQCVRQMVIFEIVNLDRQVSLDLVDTYLQWEGEAIDLAVVGGYHKVVDYILNKNAGFFPTNQSIMLAAKAGHSEVLSVLDFYGIRL